MFSDVMNPVLALNFVYLFTLQSRTDFNLASCRTSAGLVRFMEDELPIS